MKPIETPPDPPWLVKQSKAESAKVINTTVNTYPRVMKADGRRKCSVPSCFWPTKIRKVAVDGHKSFKPFCAKHRKNLTAKEKIKYLSSS